MNMNMNMNIIVAPSGVCHPCSEVCGGTWGKRTVSKMEAAAKKCSDEIQ